MDKLIITYLPYLISAITIWMFFLAGNKNKYAWIVGGFNQALWFVWIMISGNYGLMPMNFVLWIVFARNFRKWFREESNQ